MWPSRKLFTAIYLLAAAVRLLLVFGAGHYETGRPEAIKIAIALATKGAFADPYVIPTGPTAHAPPLYPALIAPFYAIYGDTPAADVGRIALSCLTASVEYALLPLVSVALGLGVWPGIFAGVGGALLPLHLWPECMGEFENTWAALLLECATLLFARFLRAPSLEWRRAARGGVFCGAALLMAPNLLPAFLAFGAIAAWKLRPGPVAAARLAGAWCAAALLVLSPWMVRNYRELGGFVLVRDNFALELDVSNNDLATGNLTENTGNAHFAKYHPHQSVAAAQEIVRGGELAFERKVMSRALGWIGAHPGRFAQLSLERTWLFWFPRVPRFRWAYGLCSIFSLAGLALLLRQRRFTGVVLTAVVIAHAAVYCVIQNVLRYEHPIWWVEVLVMGWMAHQVWLRVRPTARPAASDNFRG